MSMFSYLKQPNTTHSVQKSRLYKIPIAIKDRFSFDFLA